MNSGFFQRADDFKPILVRLLARRKHGPPLTTLEIAMKAGRLPAIIEKISWSSDWDDIQTMKLFVDACEVNFESARQMNRVYYYLRNKPNFEYLRTHKEWKTRWLPMMIQWRNCYPLKLADDPKWKPLRDLLTRLNHLHKEYKK